MGQNKIINNNSTLIPNNVGQSLGQEMGQWDKIKQTALAKLSQDCGLSQGLSRACPSGGTAKTRVNTESKPVCPIVPLVPQKHSGTEELKRLLREVGAKIEPGPKLVFIPYLDGPKVNRKRWDLAMKLEGLFWEAYERGLI